MPLIYGGKLMTKRYYGYYDSPLGILEVITSEEAVISAIFIKAEKQSQEINEKQEEAEILREAIKQFDEYFKGIRKEFNLKLEIEGTEFQKAAWEALMKIPYGETRSYKEQAVSMGREKAVRAVGNANGKNLISIIIPCHRVIGADKSLTGYTGGIDKKQWLLDHENKHK